VTRGRSTIAATLLAVLLVPAVGSTAGPKKKLDELDRKQEVINSRIRSDSEKVNSLTAEIDALNASLTRAGIKINGLKAEIAKVEDDVASDQKVIDATQRQIDKVQKRAMRQAVELYKEGNTATLDALLDSQSLTELDEKAEMVRIGAQQNTDALIKYSRLQVTIKDQHARLFARQEDLEGKLASLQELVDSQTKEQDRVALAVGKIRKRLGINESKESHLERAEAVIRGDLASWRAKQAVLALGTSSTGFIWPINGAINSPFGPRWGRMHTGIDIDGYSGQPIVAAKEGTVALASYYSGYGNAVIIDHGGGYSTLYGHMSAFNTSAGATVDQGDLIGYVGCTGNCTGDHVHFEVQINGSQVDPMLYLP
jgi:murein DD-endopeptidase MepM/ murein hydrolase activator NlpD